MTVKRKRENKYVGNEKYMLKRETNSCIKFQVSVLALLCGHQVYTSIEYYVVMVISMGKEGNRRKIADDYDDSEGKIDRDNEEEEKKKLWDKENKGDYE